MSSFAGISRDSWHKRRATGGKKVPIRKKRKFELGRPASGTKVRWLVKSTVRVEMTKPLFLPYTWDGL